MMDFLSPDKPWIRRGLLLAACLAVSVLHAQDGSPDADTGSTAAPRGGPPNMIPPPPPNITPPSLPPNMKPPAFIPEDDPLAQEAMQGPRGEDMAMIERFLQLPPENLAKIRRTLERIENMSEAERQQLIQRISEFKRMNAQRRQGFMRQMQGLTREERRNVMSYLFRLSPEDRQAEQQKFSAMEEAERTAYLKDLAAAHPAPPRASRGGGGRGPRGDGPPRHGDQPPPDDTPKH